MDEEKLKNLVYQFWAAVIKARNAGDLDWDERFTNFPTACCRDASDLLAKFLYKNGFNTLSVYGDCQGSTHRWLVWDDGQIGPPETWRFEDVVPAEIMPYYESYGSNISSKQIPYHRYSESDIENCLIIDITADQFGDPPVYCDYWMPIRQKYKFAPADKYENLRTNRLRILYDKIINFIGN